MNLPTIIEVLINTLYSWDSRVFHIFLSYNLFHIVNCLRILLSPSPKPQRFPPDSPNNPNPKGTTPFMDGLSGYNQIRMHPENQEKTTFVTKWGMFVGNDVRAKSGTDNLSTNHHGDNRGVYPIIHACLFE